MMTQVPWERMVQARHRNGWTQFEVADGLITQSMLSQIERGRVVPADKTISALARRLQLDEADMVHQWSLWRQRERVRDGLWEAVGGADGDAVRQWLNVGAIWLSPFERHVFAGFEEALTGRFALAGQLLDEAWTLDGGTWTAKVRKQALATEALARAAICRGLERWAAADYWQTRAGQRLATGRRS